MRLKRLYVGPDADLFAGLTAATWQKQDGYAFLARLIEVPAFCEAWQRAGAYARECDVVQPRYGSEEPPRVFRACFTDDVIEETVRALSDSVMAG